MKFVDKVKSKFEEYNFNVSNVYNIKGDKTKFYMHLDECILHIDEKQKNIDIAFNLLTLPDEVAKITLITMGVKELNHISVMDSYFFDKNGEVLNGQDAVNEFMKEIAERESLKLEMLHGMKCFNC